MNTELMPFRLKSARRKKRLQKQDFDKQLLKLKRRHDEIRNNKEILMERLEMPYQKGWKRLFVLKKETARSDKAEFYQQILDKINTVQYHYDESFKRRNNGKRIYRGDYKELPILQSVDEYHWNNNKSNLSNEQKAYFKPLEYWSEQHYRQQIYYKFAQPELFEIVVLPYIVYEVKLGDALLAQEESFLDDYLYNGKKPACRLAKITGGKYNRWNTDYDEKSKNVDPFKNRQVWKVLEEL